MPAAAIVVNPTKVDDDEAFRKSSPWGPANLLARNMGLPMGTDQALAVALGGVQEPIDAGRGSRGNWTARSPDTPPRPRRKTGCAAGTCGWSSS
jgi:hypothetical protein